MFAQTILGALFFAAIAAAQSDSSVVAVFLFGRHGDRTSKFTGIGIEGNAILTTLGKNQIFDTAEYFRNKYISSTSPDYIQDISASYQYTQIYASAPYAFRVSLLIVEMIKLSAFRPLLLCRAYFPRLTLPTLKLLRTAPVNLIPSMDINMCS